MQDKEQLSLPHKPDKPSSNNSRVIEFSLALEDDIIISMSERIAAQYKNSDNIKQKEMKARFSKIRNQLNKSKQKISNNIEEKVPFIKIVRQYNGRTKNKRRSKERRKHKAFTIRLWRDKEDKAITELVKKYGEKKWMLISRKLEEEYKIYGRSGKQCRER